MKCLYYYVLFYYYVIYVFNYLCICMCKLAFYASADYLQRFFYRISKKIKQELSKPECKNHHACTNKFLFYNTTEL